ncbi:MAG: MFS transporter [Holosporales bacterium]|jgi:PAT family beta-lactamase induction signal transducer AmpG|nr:MFS transporter [Holosporales bacterium]
MNRRNLLIDSFIFFSALLSGVVLLGTSQAFSFMLAERGIDVATITRLMLASIPYSWKFAISPFTKNIIVKYSYLKSITCIAHLLVLIGLILIGIFAASGSLVLLGIIVFITVTAVSVQDVVRAYVKLKSFEQNELGIITSIENAGFRIGMFLSGAGLLYIADSFSWKVAYVFISLTALIAAISTVLIPNLKHTEREDIYSIKKYIKTCAKFFKNSGILLLAIMIISFKFADSSINCLKGCFLHSLGINKLLFANISSVLGMFIMMISGGIAGGLIYKIGNTKCVKLSLLANCMASTIFIFLSLHKVNVFSLTILINTATFIFGFSNVVFRTFIANHSNGDVNIYTILLSVGSVVRILSYSIAGVIASKFSWPIMFAVCLILNIPGVIVFSKIKR